MKSNAKYYSEVVASIYTDACNKCPADVSDFRDLLTIRSRVEREGLGFLTLALPRFCADFEKSLRDGYIDSTSFLGFRKDGRIPCFLKGIVSLLFDRENGSIYDETSNSYELHPLLVDCVRQICLTFKKLEMDCAPERVSAALINFAEVERSFDDFTPTPEDVARFKAISSVLWDNLVYRISGNDFVPKHGPGATAEGISGNAKYRWQTWHERLDNYFPLLDNALSISALESGEYEDVRLVPEEDELPVKVTPVPKTLKGPRIIAVEPVCMQYAQQAIRRVLYDAIESSKQFSGHVCFRKQDVNQDLAMRGSRSGLLATIDLSDASDRVPRDLALHMFDASPELRGAIDACRSTRAKLPNGQVIGPLRKFASMGSALCFPVEAMYFYTICVMAMLEELELPVTHANAYKVSRGIWVYGDDIIVPTKYAGSVRDHLHKYNCKVNMSKSFWTGRFRESCGKDWYGGELVTPTYIRRLFPTNRSQSSELISLCSTANQFYLKGYWNTANHLYRLVERLLGPLPYVSETSPGLGRLSYLGFRSVERWNPKLHRYEVRTWCPSPVYRTDPLEGYAALQKCLLGLSSNVDIAFEDVKHLERAPLHAAVTLQRRWVASQ